jgi:uracil-DNA glycosylase
LQSIDAKISHLEITPAYENVMKAYSNPLSKIKVAIFGQDPYPTPGVAQGLAFSAGLGELALPASLRNIFKELHSDCGVAPAHNGDLTRWAQQGVFLLNRILTTKPGESLTHESMGWKEFTEATAQVLGKNQVIGVFWGNKVKDLQEFFDDTLIIESAHPSPLSAYRGFFGSKPFSKINELLREQNKSQINW